MLPLLGRLGPVRAKVGLGFTVVGLFRRFRVSLGPGQVCWLVLVFSPSSSFHPHLFFVLTFTSFGGLTPCLAGRVCGTSEPTLTFAAWLLYYILVIARDHRGFGGVGDQ